MCTPMATLTSRVFCAWMILGGVAVAQPARPTIGVAFGGGSARGLAHIGVIAWLEEHHVPIDMAAGTSMGGLVGGAFASGMNAAELRELILNTDWDTMFGSSSFPFKNIRRKEDARSYPSRLEFGLKRGVVPPTALNSGQQVDQLLARIAAAYYAVHDFDDLPTPFRTVAVDLRTAERVVIDRGYLALAMRATMSLPGIFPPVVSGDRVLVDGGALDNVPADVVRDMGAEVVIAVDVGYQATASVDYSLFGLMGGTVDAMMRANTRRAIASADLTIFVDVKGFGSLDWRRSEELIQRGYAAAAAESDRLLPYALGDEEWAAWVARREARRRRGLPAPTFIATAGLAPADAALVRRTLARHVGALVDLTGLEADLAELSGLDRYSTIGWQIVGAPGREGLLVRGHEKAYAPPFMMLGVNLQNTTSDDFIVQLAGRYLAFDVAGSGSELRIDGTIGSNPSAAISLYRPLRGSHVFVRPFAGFSQSVLNFVEEETVVAKYRERRAVIGGDFGVTVGRVSEISAGLRAGRLSATIEAGDPGLPELAGLETQFQARWLFDSQDSPAVPSRGTRAAVALAHVFRAPEAAGVPRSNDRLTQMEGGASSFWSLNRRNRFFIVAAGGTSFHDEPLPTSQFTVGYPFRLDAFTVGERRGNHYGVVTAGLLRQYGRLPDFLGGPIFAGVWFENGAVFDRTSDIDFNTQAGLGVMMDTLVGPVLLGTGIGFDGGWRTFVGVGRVFR